jgi:hypothetical protein
MDHVLIGGAFLLSMNELKFIKKLLPYDRMAASNKLYNTEIILKFIILKIY